HLDHTIRPASTSPSLHTHSSSDFRISTPSAAIFTLSLHDALPISSTVQQTHGLLSGVLWTGVPAATLLEEAGIDPRGKWALVHRDRKSTRLNSSHQISSYAVFCVKKKKNKGSQRQSVEQLTYRRRQ